MNAHTIEAECAACDGNGWKLTRNPNVLMRGCHEVPCQKCNATGWLECPNKGGVDCPHPQQCICEAAWERQEQDKMENG